MTIYLRAHNLITYNCKVMAFNEGFYIIKGIAEIKAAYSIDIQSFCCDFGLEEFSFVMPDGVFVAAMCSYTL